MHTADSPKHIFMNSIRAMIEGIKQGEDEEENVAELLEMVQNLVRDHPDIREDDELREFAAEALVEIFQELMPPALMFTISGLGGGPCPACTGEEQNG